MAEDNAVAYVAAAVARTDIAVDDLLGTSASFAAFSTRIAAMWAVAGTRYEVPAQVFEADPTFAEWP